MQNAFKSNLLVPGHRYHNSLCCLAVLKSVYDPLVGGSAQVKLPANQLTVTNANCRTTPWSASQNNHNTVKIIMSDRYMYMYACEHVSMYVYISKYESMYAFMTVCMHVYMYVFMMYVYM